MGFDRGMAGVVVVVLALISSVMLCVVTNIESKDVTKELPEYVADITGGFTADREKSYSDYNPSGNYNGYTNNTTTTTFPVNFESSGFVNNYPISYRVSQSTSSTFTSPTSFQTPPIVTSFVKFPGYISGTETHSRLDYNTLETLFTEDHYIQGPVCDSNMGFSYNGYFKPLSSILSECVTEGTSIIGATPTTIIIDIPNMITVERARYNWIEIYDSDEIVNVYHFNNNIMVLPTGYNMSGDLPEYYTSVKLQNIGANTVYNTSILYSPADNSCTVSINDVPIFTGNPNRYSVYYGTVIMSKRAVLTTTPAGESQGYTSETRYASQELTQNTPNLQVTYSAQTVTDYIDTRYGVGIRTGENVDWFNKQQNGITSIAMSVWDDSTKTFTDTGTYSNTGAIRYYGSDSTDTFTVSRTSGRTYVSLNSGTPIDIGTWPQIQLNIDNINGVMSITPISFWNNFNNYSLAETTVTIGNITKGSLDTITWTANNSFRLQVSNTTVFFNTYGVVMIDPYINITNFWPNYPKFMVSLTKVATIGDSITLGNTTFPITNGAIEVNDKTLAIPDIKLIYENTGENQWTITLETDKASTQITESNTYISLAGTWYFNAGFYEIVEKTVTERVWDPAYAFNLNLIVIFMAGFILLGGLLIYKMGYADMMSIVVLVVSEAILMVIGGTS